MNCSMESSNMVAQINGQEHQQNLGHLHSSMQMPVVAYSAIDAIAKVYDSAVLYRIQSLRIVLHRIEGSLHSAT